MVAALADVGHVRAYTLRRERETFCELAAPTLSMPQFGLSRAR